MLQFAYLALFGSATDGSQMVPPFILLFLIRKSSRLTNFIVFNANRYLDPVALLSRGNLKLGIPPIAKQSAIVQ